MLPLPLIFQTSYRTWTFTCVCYSAKIFVSFYIVASRKIKPGIKESKLQLPTANPILAADNSCLHSQLNLKFCMNSCTQIN